MGPSFSRIILELPAMDEITVDPLQQELAAKAKQILGYGLLEEHLQGGVVTQTRERAELSTLVQTFNELDIQPLNAQEVERYQQQEKQKLNRKSFFALPRYAQLFVLLDKMFSFFDCCPKWLGWVIFFGSFIGAIVDIYLLCVTSWRIAACLSPTTFSALCIVYLLCFEDRVKKLTLQEWGWTKLTFTECYQRKVEIPQFALDTAIRIKEKMPDADLFVETATSTDMALGDPFLCIQHGGVKHYLEVWDESRFERRTTRKV